MINCSQLLEKLRKFYHYFKNFEYLLLNIILHLARVRGGVLKVDDVTGIKLQSLTTTQAYANIYGTFWTGTKFDDFKNRIMGKSPTH